jgi:large exoprotein involved in heme utilization and adhesion
MFATTGGTPLLTVSVPVGLQFGPNPGAIVNRSQFRFPGLPVDVYPGATGLTLVSGGTQTLAFVGGEIRLENGSLAVPGGRIELGAVGPNSYVSLNPTAVGWVLGYEGTNTFGDIRLSGESSVDTSGGTDLGVPGVTATPSNGPLVVTGDRVFLTGGSRLISLNLGTVRGGDIVVNARRSLEIEGTGNYPEALRRYSGEDFQFFDLNNGIFTVGYGPASAGGIIVNTERLSLRDRGFISTSTGGDEKVGGGDLVINASRAIELRASAILTSTTLGTRGDAGNLVINTATLTLEDNALISTSTLGSGRGGDLTVNATDLIVLRGATPFPLRDGVFTTTGLATNSLNVGAAGNLEITTDRLSIQGGAVVSAGTFATGNGGILNVTANEILLTGRSPDGRYNSQISAFTGDFSTGTGGNVQVNARALQIEKGAAVSASSLGTGTAGNVRIRADRLVLRDGGTIEARSALSRGGDISIETNSLLLENRAGINATAAGSEKAGNIEILARDALQIIDSEIATSALFSSGGDLTVEAGAIRLEGNSDLRTSVFSGTGGRGEYYPKGGFDSGFWG